MAPFFLTTILWSLLLSIAFPSHIDHHMLFPNQKLLPKQTLISQNQVFEMGFFSPGKSSNRFLGVWYKSTPDVVVWVANRNDPITASQAPVFMISGNGSLVISSGNNVIWSENPSRAASNPFLHLLDIGNLVVNESNATRDDHLWESFDYPTDTFLPGMKLVNDIDAGVEKYLTSWRNPDDPSPGDFIFKIHNHGLVQMVALKGTKKIYRSGQWNGRDLCGQSFPNPNYKPKLVFRQEKLISVHELYDSSFLVRFKIDALGTLLRVTMNAKKDKWNPPITFPIDTCDKYDSCGPNCICRSDSPSRCQCFKGFKPKIQNDWDLLQDW